MQHPGRAVSNGGGMIADLIAPALAALIPDGPARDAQSQAMALTMDRLGKGGEAPGLRAARSVLAHLG